MGEDLRQGARDIAEAEKTAGSVELGAAVVFRGSTGGTDGSAEIAVSPDSMLAEASFYPPGEGGMPLDTAYVFELLARLGVSEGLLADEVAEAVMQCNLDRKVLRGVAVARGKPPENEVPEHAELDEKFRKHGPIIAKDGQRVDFRELFSYFVVKAGEAIARIAPRREGSVGIDIKGNSLPFARTEAESWTAGRNIEVRGDNLVAVVDGRLSAEAGSGRVGRLDVDEVFLVKGGVDFHTGHVDFPGDVVVEGTVHDGFRVHAGGSLICKSTLDAFDVEAKKDLICAQGIVGKHRAQIRVGGELKAKYVQNCSLAVRGDIHVAAAIIGSRVFCLGSIDLGDKGTLMGGDAWAAHGLRCGRLGNEAHQPTLVHVGVDFTVRQRMEKANERLRMVAARERQIEEAAKRHPGPQANHARAEIAAASAAARTALADLAGHLDVDEGALVSVKGDIFPGVVIEICRVSIVVEERLKNCRFKLDKAAGRIVVER